MGRSERTKGRRGETEAKKLLQDQDYIILADTTAGLATCDIIAEKDGHIYEVEVKNRRIIDVPRFTGQARKNARRQWMLMCKIDSTNSWLVMAKGKKPTVWHGKEANNERTNP